MLNVVSIHSTSFTMANTILDLYSSDPACNYVEGLRNERDRVLAEADGLWSKEAVSALARADSTIKESMRLSTFGIIAQPRRVRTFIMTPEATALLTQELGFCS